MVTDFKHTIMLLVYDAQITGETKTAVMVRLVLKAISNPFRIMPITEPPEWGGSASPPRLHRLGFTVSASRSRSIGGESTVEQEVNDLLLCSRSPEDEGV